MSKAGDPRHLIVSADQRLWPLDEPCLFLGRWCTRPAEAAVWEKIDHRIAEPLPILGVEALVRHTQICRAFEADLFPVFAQEYAQMTGHSFSEQDCAIFTACWFRRAISILYNRVETLRHGLAKYDVSGVTLFEPGAYRLSVERSTAFVWACCDPAWNAELWARIWPHIADESVPVRFVAPQSIQGFRQAHAPAPSGKRRLLEALTRLTAGRASMLLLNSYLPAKEAAKVLARFWSLPQVWPTARPPIHAPDDGDLRARLSARLAARFPPGFAQIVADILPQMLPISMLEGLPEVTKNMQNLKFPRAPTHIFTSSNFDYDEEFKLYALLQRRKGAEYMIGQHGNMYGTCAQQNPYPEEQFADKFLTWGDGTASSRHRDGFVFRAPYPGRFQSNPAGKVLLVEYSSPLQIYVHDASHEFEGFFQNQLSFVSNLSASTRDQLVVRLSGTTLNLHESDEDRWRRFDSSLSLDVFSRSIADAISDSRLVVFSYDSTGMLECLTQDVPFVGFWTEPIQRVRPDAKEMYQEMMEAGILFDDPVKLAKHVDAVFADVQGWWRSNQVQTALKNYSDRYARRVDNPVVYLHKKISE